MLNETDHSGASWWVVINPVCFFLFMFCHFRDSGPLLRTLKKGWAKGARLAFLESHIQAYKEAGLHSKCRRTAYVDQVVNEWFTRWHWTLPIESDDPSDPSKPSTTIAEDLSPADAKLKGEVINHIGKVCAWIMLNNMSLT